MAKPTLDHVAKQAGVSVTTASLVLAGKGNISEAVRLRVLESVQALGYRRKNPNGSRQAEKGNAVSIVIPFDDQWAHTLHFIRPVIVELEKVLVAKNLFPVLQPVYHESDLEETVSRITGGSIKGVFSIQYGNTKLFQKLETMGIPVVVVMNNNFQDTFFSICVDDFQGAYEGSVHLIRLGHRHIAYMDYPRPDLPAAVTDRYIGFKKALDEYGVSFSEGMRLTLPFGDSEVLRRGLETLFAGQSGPEAIFCT